MRRKIEIEWSKPLSIEAFWNDVRRKEIGLYCVSRKNGGLETLLYIGKATVSFSKRIRGHQNDKDDWWMNELTNSILIRLGRITHPKEYTEADIQVAENGLIYEMKPVGNIKQVNQYTYNYKNSHGNMVGLAVIENKGNKLLRSTIDMYEQE